nr:putative GDP-fucose protein O-fucosyltransferase [Tanacetum cinerariifolium]GFC18497.1 putative GDP-fucose protein O-fucosyltransferase [Tanacetum cinerariifolium]
EEKKELQAYREMHFPGLVDLNNNSKIPSSERLKAEGLCPLMPEETVLMLAGLGFKRETRIFFSRFTYLWGKFKAKCLNDAFS